MNTGAFGENFPYSNFHDLNMDWIIKIAKDFLDQYTNIQETITNGLSQIDTQTEQALESLENKKTELEALLDQWYNTHSQDIATQLATATQQFATYAEQVGANVIASIPDDYTALSNEVELLKGDFIQTGTINSVFSNIQIIGRHAHDINFNDIRNAYNNLTGFSIRGLDQNEVIYENYSLLGMEGNITAVCNDGTILTFHYDLNNVPVGTRLLQQTGFIVKQSCYINPILPMYQRNSSTSPIPTNLLSRNQSDYTEGKYYGHGNITISSSASACILNEPIQIVKDMTYYFCSVYGFFSDIVYEDGTIVALSDSVETNQSGYFTATQNGELYVTLPVNAYNDLRITLVRTAPNKWLEVYPTDDILLMTKLGAGQTIHFNSGLYNIITQYENHYGATFFQSYQGYTSATFKDGMAGVPIFRGTHVIASPGALFRAYYTGNNTNVNTKFSAFALESDVIIENMFINCVNLRNAIHDDFDNEYEGQTVIKNCTLINTGIVLAGGLAIHDDVKIEDCIMLNNTTDATYDFSYHNSGDASAQSKLTIKDNYCFHTIRVAYYGESTTATDVIITNNSLKTNYIKGREGQATIDNITIRAWNNEIREN